MPSVSSVSKIYLVLVIFTLFALFPCFRPALADEEENRTVNRTLLGRIVPPGWVYARPNHYEFLPLVSNHDPQNQHPAAWLGQDWDPSQWNSSWTADAALEKIFQARIFENRYLRHGGTPVVELGPTFFKLSDLDQRRTLKLLTEQTEIFKRGFDAIELVDWSTHDILGAYTPKGLFLN